MKQTWIRLALLLVLAATSARGVHASPPGALPAENTSFEAVSIKPRVKGAAGMTGVEVFRNGRVLLQGFTTKALVAAAFDAPLWQVQFPAHMDDTRYDIEAKAPELPEGQEYDIRHGFWTVDDPKLRTMLQNLLADRFQLHWKWTDERGSVYILERSTKPLTLKPGPPLASSESGTGEVSVSAGRGWSLFNASMQDVANHLSSYTFHCPVLDKTGLHGGFFFQSKNVVTSEDYQSGVETVEHMLIPALDEMGLKLTKTTGDFKRLEIISVELPSAN